MALLAATAALKLVYVFALTDYRSYLFSDFAGYWYRALGRLGGSELDTTQWAVWPPLTHILLSDYLRAVDLLGFSRWRLEATLVANVAMSTASTAVVYGIAKQTLKRSSWALGVAALYAFTFPLVYFNAFVMSEHFATLCMLAAAWFALRSRDAMLLSTAGALLGLATALRPGFGLFGIAFVVYIAWADRFARVALGRAAAFSLGFALIVGAAAVEAHRISQGRVVGLGANGGITFYLSQCQTRKVITRYEGRDYEFVEPALADRPENGSVRFDRPIHDQAFFAGLGWQCMRDQMDLLAGASKRFRNLFFGPLLPSVPSALGFAALLPVFRWFFLLCTLALPLAFVVRRSCDVQIDALALQVGILAVAAIGLYIFPAEHRFLYPLTGPLYISCAAVLLAATCERRVALLAITWAAALGALFAGSIALGAITAPPVDVTIYRFALPLSGTQPGDLPMTTFGVRKLSYETPERLYPLRPDGTEDYAVFRTCLNVRKPGTFELLVLSDASATLSIDGAILVSQRDPHMDRPFGRRTQLAVGRHAYTIRVDRPFGLKATWRYPASPADYWRPGFGLHYIGESGAALEFLPAARCNGGDD
ncbi:MAG TPA: hypothetical protein VEU32_09290 [Burkholderiales bacterium]|nr:hypothetical protein [Burkholderiales bacterium]